jgi:hypothetical protein
VSGRTIDVDGQILTRNIDLGRVETLTRR